MFKLMSALIMALIFSSSAFAVDLTKMDGQYTGSTCTNLELFVYYTARNYRDISKEPPKFTKQRIEAAFEGAQKHKLYELIQESPKYFENLRDYMYLVTDEIWELNDVSPGMLADLMRINCQNLYFKQETDNFITMKTIGKMRGWLK